MVHHRPGWLDPIFVGLSYAGLGGAIWLVLAALAAFLWRRPWLLAAVAGADLAADLSSWGLRVAIGRPRPPIRYPEPHALVPVPKDASFPSGHASTSFACAAVLAWAMPRFAAPLLLLATAIAWSRVYVGVHYPLDVLGGAALGLLVASAVRALQWLGSGRRRSVRAPRGG